MAMGLSAGLAAAVFSFFLLSLVAAYGEKISNREYLAMKRQLKALRKPGVKVIKTEYGDIYDCVDVQKQPSLDHPLLKNHTVQVSQTNYDVPSEIPKKDASTSGLTSADISLPDGGCPKGTVPIKRLTVEDLIVGREMRRMKRKQFLLRTNNLSTNAIDGFHHHYAVVKAHSNRPFYGFSARLNVWNPGTVAFGQSSIAQVWLYGTPLNPLSVIEAGWMVSPNKYSDSRVYLFTFWTSDNYRNGCYNMDCHGFVHTSPRVGIPSFISEVSIYNGTQKEILMQISRDPQSGHWLLKYGADGHLVGYWPSGLLPNMKSHTNEVHWGGEVAAKNNVFPPMGSGRFAQQEQKKACYMTNIKLIDQSGKLIDVPSSAQTYMTDTTCYNVLDYLPDGSPFGRHTYFGGPGGKCKIPPN